MALVVSTQIPKAVLAQEAVKNDKNVQKAEALFARAKTSVRSILDFKKGVDARALRGLIAYYEDYRNKCSEAIGSVNASSWGSGLLSKADALESFGEMVDESSRVLWILKKIIKFEQEEDYLRDSMDVSNTDAFITLKGYIQQMINLIYEVEMVVKKIKGNSHAPQDVDELDVVREELLTELRDDIRKIRDRLIDADDKDKLKELKSLLSKYKELKDLDMIFD